MLIGISKTCSALQQLQVGELGRVTHLTTPSLQISRALQDAGFHPGALVTLEQRFPRFVVRVGLKHIALSEPEIRAISVQLQGIKPDWTTKTLPTDVSNTS